MIGRDHVYGRPPLGRNSLCSLSLCRDCAWGGRDRSGACGFGEALGALACVPVLMTALRRMESSAMLPIVHFGPGVKAASKTRPRSCPAVFYWRLNDSRNCRRTFTFSVPVVFQLLWHRPSPTTGQIQSPKKQIPVSQGCCAAFCDFSHRINAMTQTTLTNISLETPTRLNPLVTPNLKKSFFDGADGEFCFRRIAGVVWRRVLLQWRW